MKASDLHRLARLLREVASWATNGPEGDSLNAGQLAVFEDVLKNPGTTVGEVARRTGLAQSLVSRVVLGFGAEGVFVVAKDPDDRRRTLLEVSPVALAESGRRASRSVHEALATRFPQAGASELDALERDLSAVEHRIARLDRAANDR